MEVGQEQANGFTAGQSVAWWRETKQFQTAIEPHTLLFAGEGPEAQLQVHSVRRPLEAYVKSILKLIEQPRYATKRQEYEDKLGKPVVPSDSRGDGDEATVSGIQQKLYVIKTRPTKTGGVENVYFGPEIGTEINRLLTAMANLLTTLPDPDTPDLPAVRPKSWNKYEAPHETQPIDPKDGMAPMTSVSRDGKAVEAHVSSAPGTDVGSDAAPTSPLFFAIKQRRGTEIAPGHVLNHQLYGSGKIVENIAPIPKTNNVGMSNDIEQHAQDLVFGQNKVILYKMRMIWPAPGEAVAGYSALDRAYPKEIEGSIQLHTFRIERFPIASQEQLATEMLSWDNWTVEDRIEKPYNKKTERFLNPPTNDEVQRYAEKWLDVRKKPGMTWTKFFNTHNLYVDGKKAVRDAVVQRVAELTSDGSEPTETPE